MDMRKFICGVAVFGLFAMSARAAAIQGGDTDTTKGPDDICIFNTTGEHTLTVNEEVANVEILIVAGGGGGGYGGDYAGGGGGGGGVVQLKSQTLTAGSYSLTVGAAGLGATTSANGGNGGDSTFNDGTTVWTAKGGGGGGKGGAQGSAGGSGGGSSKKPGAASTQNKYSGCGFGNASATSDSTGTPSGGGGAGSSGSQGGSRGSAGPGGAGLVFGTSGTKVMYGAGGTAGGATPTGVGSGGGSVLAKNGNGRDGTAGVVIVRVRRKVDLSDATVTIPAQTWTGSAVHPAPTVVDSISGNTVDSSDYDLEYLTDCVTQGVHTVRIIGKNNAFETNDAPFRIVLPTVYVATMGDDTNDGTEAHPFKTIAYAIEAQRAGYNAGYTDPLKISIAAGTHASPFATLNFPVTLEGNVANPSQVIINDATTGKRAFTISNGSVVLSGLKIQGTGRRTNDSQGGHIYMSAGTISDCIVTGGNAGDNGAGYGGNIYMTGGKVIRTQVLNGKGVATAGKTYATQGCNVYMTGGTLENCLVKGGYSGCSGTVSGRDGHGAGIYVNGAATVVNCTIVGNSCYSANHVAGVYVNNASARVLNCVIYGNGGTAAKEWGNRNGARYTNCGFGAGLAPAAGVCCIDTVTDAAFTDYANGDLTLVENSALADRGSIVAADIALAGTLDLAKNSRAIGIPDVGAYEYQVVGFAVRASSTLQRTVVGTEVGFTATNYNASAAVTYTWNFGDGSASVSGAEVAHTYTAAGQYAVTVTGTAGGSETSYTLPYTIAVVNPLATDIYVSPSGNDYSGDGSSAHPLATITYAASIMKAAGSSGATIHVGPGTIKEYSITLDFAVTVQGDGATRADTIVNANSAGRAFYLNHADAVLKNMVITNGYMSGAGGNIYIKDGRVIGCDIVKGATADNSQGGNVYMANGRLANCRVLDGIVNRPGSTAGGYWGGGVYAAGNAVVENCLIKGNYKYKTNGGTYRYDNRGLGAVADGSSRFVNCTFIANREPSYGGQPITIKSTNARVVNCVFYKNQPASLTEDLSKYEYGEENINRFINCAAFVPAPSGSTSCVTELADADFVDFANGDYHPMKGGKLVKAGTSWTDYQTYGGTSTTDLDGNRWGKTLDIGCYCNPSEPGLILLFR